MSVVANPLKKARGVTTVMQAARLLASLEAELALNENMPPGWEAEAEQAVTVLRERFPDAENHSAYEEGPPLSRGAKRTVNPPEPKEPKAPAPGGNPRPNRRPGGTPAAPARRYASRGARRSTGRFGGGVGGALLRPTTDIVGSGGEFVVKVIGWGIGLSLLYLLLTNASKAPAGKSGVEQLFGGVTAGIGALVGSHADPLTPATWQRAAAPAAPAPAAARAAPATTRPKLTSNTPLNHLVRSTP